MQHGALKSIIALAAERPCPVCGGPVDEPAICTSPDQVVLDKHGNTVRQVQIVCRRHVLCPRAFGPAAAAAANAWAWEATLKRHRSPQRRPTEIRPVTLGARLRRLVCRLMGVVDSREQRLRLAELRRRARLWICPPDPKISVN